jgi:hypothetical protein
MLLSTVPTPESCAKPVQRSGGVESIAGLYVKRADLLRMPEKSDLPYFSTTMDLP